MKYKDIGLPPSNKQIQFFNKHGWIMGDLTRLQAYEKIKKWIINRKVQKDLEKLEAMRRNRI